MPKLLTKLLQTSPQGNGSSGHTLRRDGSAGVQCRMRVLSVEAAKTGFIGLVGGVELNLP